MISFSEYTFSLIIYCYRNILYLTWHVYSTSKDYLVSKQKHWSVSGYTNNCISSLMNADTLGLVDHRCVIPDNIKNNNIYRVTLGNND